MGSDAELSSKREERQSLRNLMFSAAVSRPLLMLSRCHLLCQHYHLGQLSHADQRTTVGAKRSSNSVFTPLQRRNRNASSHPASCSYICATACLNCCCTQREVQTPSEKPTNHGGSAVATGGVHRLVAHQRWPCPADGAQRYSYFRHRQPGPVQEGAGCSHVPGDRRRGECRRRSRAGRSGLQGDLLGRENKEVLGGCKNQAQLLHAVPQRPGHHLERRPQVLDLAPPERRKRRRNRNRDSGAAERLLAGGPREAGAVPSDARSHLRGLVRGEARRPSLRMVDAGEPPAQVP